MDIFSKTHSPSLVKPRRHRWQDDAVCSEIGDGPFFVGEHSGRDPYKDARAICASCPVRAMCLEYILKAEEDPDIDRVGFFAGTTPRDRKQIAKERQANVEHQHS